MPALSSDTRNRLGYALASNDAAKELADIVDTPLTDFPLASGKIIVGDVNGAAQAVTPTGDVTVSNVGAIAVTPAKLANGKTSVIKTAGATVDVLAAAAVARNVILAVVIDEVYANGNGAQPTVSLDEEGTVGKFAATTKFTSAAAAATLVFSGQLAANKKLQLTSTAATGTATGGLTVIVIATS